MSETEPKNAPLGSDQDLAVPAAKEPTGRTVRAHLALFTVALVLPALLFTGVVLWQFATTERARLENEAMDLAVAMATAVDRDLSGVYATLDVLATSPYLKVGDLEGFHRQGAELLRLQGIVTVLIDPAGQQLVNLRVPWGNPLPISRVSFSQADLASRRPFVTGYVVGQVTGNKQILAATAVERDGRLAYILFLSLPVERLQNIMKEADVPAEWQAAITDRAGIVLARARRPEDFVGRLASANFREVATGRRGVWYGTTLDGIASFGSYARSDLSGFYASTAIDISTLNAPLWRSLSLLAALGAVIATISTLLGIVFGRRITGAIQQLAEQSGKLGRGEAMPPLATGLAEANQVGRELSAASVSLREREADLREANEEIQRFAYIVSHDLRSPLVNIMGFTTELEALRDDAFRRMSELRGAIEAADRAKDDGLAEEFTEAIGFIKASIGKMDRLINAILRLSREGRRDFRPERVDMGALVAGIRDSLAHQAESADATVTIGTLPPIVTDRLAVEQIFSNLIDNALKYLRRGLPGRVEINGRAIGAMLVYEVRDNGRGIDPNDTQRVFDLFRRSGAQDRPGEGIGLAHVRTLVRRLGGTIGLTSVPGQGSTFTVSLPRRWTGETQGKAA